MLAELETQNRKAAREEFVAAIWAGQKSSRLLSLASAAGLTGDEADNLIARINQAKEQLVHVNQLPHLRKDAASANSRFTKVQARANAEIDRLERETNEAAYETEIAEKALHAGEDSSRQLLAMYDEGLLPAAEVPSEVLRLIHRHEAEEKFRQMDSARVTASDERNRSRAIVRNIEDRLAHLPITLTSRQDESTLQNRLKDAKRQLADAEASLKKAQTKADVARRAIP
jgi:hypothetical protein